MPPDPISTPRPSLALKTPVVRVSEGSMSDHDELRALVCSKPWPCGEALAIVDCESKGNTNERSPTGDYGILGINYENHRDKVLQVTGSEAAESLFDPWVNVEVGYMIYSGVGGPGGWEQWVCTPY